MSRVLHYAVPDRHPRTSENALTLEPKYSPIFWQGRPSLKVSKKVVHQGLYSLPEAHSRLVSCERAGRGASQVRTTLKGGDGH
jgi:hypothetical protein